MKKKKENKKKRKKERKLQLIAVRVIIIQKTIKQWVSYSENILGYDVLNHHVYLMYILDFLSAMFDEEHVTLTVQFTVQYVQQPPMSTPPLNSSFY